MTVVAGIDLSLTSTGLALATVNGDRGHSIETRLVTSKGKRADSLTDRHTRLWKMRQQIIDYVRFADFIVIEALFERTRGGSLLDRAGLWWGVVGDLIAQDADVPVVAVSPTQVKKFATGNGAADKGRMVMAASRMWEGWEPSTARSSEDEADAVALAGIGLALLGLAPFAMTQYRIDVTEKIRPDLVASPS